MLCSFCPLAHNPSTCGHTDQTQRRLPFRVPWSGDQRGRLPPHAAPRRDPPRRAACGRVCEPIAGYKCNRRASRTGGLRDLRITRTDTAGNGLPPFVASCARSGSRAPPGSAAMSHRGAVSPYLILSPPSLSPSSRDCISSPVRQWATQEMHVHALESMAQGRGDAAAERSSSTCPAAPSRSVPTP